MVKSMGWIEAADGTPLWFKIMGENKGIPPLVLCDGIGCAGYVWKYIIRDFADKTAILHWNYRGHGQSGMPMDKTNVSMDAIIDDMHRVMKETLDEPAILLGHSMGVQVVLEFWKQHPEMTAGLVPMCGSYQHPLDTFKNKPYFGMILPYLKAAYNSPLGPQIDVIWRSVVNTELGFFVAKKAEINGDLIKKEDFMPYLEVLGQMDPGLFLNMLEQAQAHSAESYLGRINVPTLIISGERDGFTPMWLSQKMASSIQGAEFLYVPAGSHTAPIEAPELVNLRIEKWLDKHFQAKAANAAETVSKPKVKLEANADKNKEETVSIPEKIVEAKPAKKSAPKYKAEKNPIKTEAAKPKKESAPVNKTKAKEEKKPASKKQEPAKPAKKAASKKK